MSVPPGPEQLERAAAAAHAEKAALAAFLKKELGVQLSETKTLVTPVTEPLRFLGYHVRVHQHPVLGRMMSAALIPKNRSQRVREAIKDIFNRSTLTSSLEERLRLLNFTLRGWGNYYRHASETTPRQRSRRRAPTLLK